MVACLGVRPFLVLALILLAALAWSLWSDGERTRPRAAARTSEVFRELDGRGEIEVPLELRQPALEPEARAPLAAEPVPPAASVQWAEDAARAYSITGIVRQPDGTPCPTASVRYVWDEEGRRNEAAATSLEDGRFELEVGKAVSGDLLACAYFTYGQSARRDVASGEQGVELVLGGFELLTVEVRDERGVVLEQAEAQFSWLLAGHLVQDSRRRGELTGARSWERPPVDFGVSVTAYGHRSQRFGPFDPAALGALLVLELEALPQVHGRVTHAGRAVPGARVGLQRVARSGANEHDVEPLGSTRGCDAEGRFVLVQPGVGEFELVAFADTLGEGRLGPLTLDGARDVTGLELELTRAPGSIEGRVILPAGHGPEEIWLSTSAASGFRALRPDGTFLLPDLRPGRCTVVVLAGGPAIDDAPGERWLHVTHGPSRAPEWLATEPTYTLEVRSGERVRLDIDLASPAACRLVGTLRLDGRAPVLRAAGARNVVRYEPHVVLDRGSKMTRQSAADVDTEGSFTLAAHGPGEYRLELKLGLDGTPSEAWRVLARVELHDGVVPWRLDVDTGSLRVVASGGERLPALTVVWKGPGGEEVQVQYPELENAGTRALFQRVPAGRVRLVPRGAQQQEEFELDVRAGELTELRWPR